MYSPWQIVESKPQLCRQHLAISLIKCGFSNHLMRGELPKYIIKKKKEKGHTEVTACG